MTSDCCILVQEKPWRKRGVHCLPQAVENAQELSRTLDSVTRRELCSRSWGWQTPRSSREQTSPGCRGHWEGRCAYREGTVESLLQLRKPLKADRLRFSKAEGRTCPARTKWAMEMDFFFKSFFFFFLT